MSTTEFLTTVLSLSVFMLGTVLALVWYLGGQIRDLAGTCEGRFARVEDRLARVDDRLERLSEDVAVLKATR